MTKLENRLASALRCALQDLDYYEQNGANNASLLAVRQAISLYDAQAAREGQTPRPQNHVRGAAEGWAWPQGAPNCSQHYFRHGSTLCHRYKNHQRGLTEQPVCGATCQMCRRKRNKELLVKKLPIEDHVNT